MKLLSKEWVDTVMAKGNVDAAYLKKAKGLTLVLQLVITDCPDQTDKLADWDFKRGKIECKVEEKAAPSDWRGMDYDPSKYFAKGIASYDAFSSVIKGETTLMAALTTGAWQIAGDPMKVMGKVAEINVFFDFLKSIPLET